MSKYYKYHLTYHHNIYFKALWTFEYKGKNKLLIYTKHPAIIRKQNGCENCLYNKVCNNRISHLDCIDLSGFKHSVKNGTIMKSNKIEFILKK